MNVLLLTDSGAIAGTEKHILTLAVGLRDGGTTALLGCPVSSALSAQAEGLGIPVVPIQKGGTLDCAAVRCLVRLLRAGEVDIVHAHNGRTAFSAALAVLLARHGRSVFTQHFLAPDYVEARGMNTQLRRLAHRWVNRHIHHFIAVSQAVRDGIVSRREAPASHITVIPNGIFPDLGALQPASVVRAELGIADSQPLVVSAGRLEPEKNPGLLLEAMALVTGAVPHAVCVLAGDGSLENALRERTGSLGLGDMVRLPGFCSDVNSLLNAADVFVLPSSVESFGLVLVEAMALEKPVIATQVGGPLEIVADGVTGLLVPPADPAAMAEAIRALLADPERRRAMGEAGRARFEAQFTAERMARETVEVYRKVLEG